MRPYIRRLSVAIVVAGVVVSVGVALASSGLPLAASSTMPVLAWLPVAPAASPPNRANSSAAYDAATQTVILFGGATSVEASAVLGDTWIWNGSNWSQQLTHSAPLARAGASMAYDSSHQVVVLFGGWNGSTILGDSWTWNGLDWTQRFPTTSPSARSGGSMAYDDAVGKVVLFGGSNGSAPDDDDTWEWDGNTWIQQFPGSSPSARYGASAAYDPGTQSIVLFGGFVDVPEPGPTVTPSSITPVPPTPGPLSGAVNDTWSWNGVTWTQQLTAIAPSPRDGAALVYFPQVQGEVLFGGYYWCCGDVADTWLRTAAGWYQISTFTSPASRDGAAFAYDTATGSAVLFGGHSTTTSPYFLDDTWLLVSPGPGTPVPRLALPIVPQSSAS